MADGILGLGTGQATTLNSELIEKLNIVLEQLPFCLKS